LDGGFLLGHPTAVRRAIDLIENEGKQCGFHLNAGKCEVITFSPHTQIPFPDSFAVGRRYLYNFDLLGSPIGSAVHCTEYVRTKVVAKCKDAWKAISREDMDAHSAYCLLRQCSGICRLVSILRTVAPHLITEALNEFDDGLRSAVDSSLGVTLDGLDASPAPYSSWWG